MSTTHSDCDFKYQLPSHLKQGKHLKLMADNFPSILFNACQAGVIDIVKHLLPNNFL